MYAAYTMTIFNRLYLEDGKYALNFIDDSERRYVIGICVVYEIAILGTIISSSYFLIMQKCGCGSIGFQLASTGR